MGESICERERWPVAAASTGVGSKWTRQTKPEQAAQLLGRAHRMIASMEVTKAIEAFNDHGKQAKQPTDQHAVGVMMTNMFEPVAVLGVIEALVFNLPTALRHVIKRKARHLARGEVRQPVGLHDGAVWFVLAIANHTHGGPVESFPGIEVVGIPDLDALVMLVENAGGRLGAEALFYGAG